MTDAATPTAHPVLNRAQEILLSKYAEGDFQYLLEIKTQEAMAHQLAECGDGLLRFLMVELSDKEDCKDLGTARDRLRTAIDQLEALDSALSDAQWN